MTELDDDLLNACTSTTLLALLERVSSAEAMSACRERRLAEAEDRADRLEAELKALREASASLLAFAERNQCTHEETERLGFIWERCRMCGRRWADDEGGKPEYVDPPEIEAMRTALEPKP